MTVNHNLSEQSQAKTVAPFGLWESAISKESIFQATREIGSPRVCLRTGRVFFTESRSNGFLSIKEARDGNYVHVLPKEYNARTRVYEYGGGPYSILPGSRIVFSNSADNSVHILDIDSGNTQNLIASKTLRYADFNAYPGNEPWVIAVEEDHESQVPVEVRNYVVAINTETKEVKRIVKGSDFYMFPSFSPDGKRISWVEWNFPDMPWSGVKLYWADWNNGALENVEFVAGGEQSATEPRWGADGYLYFCQENTNFRQLYRQKRGEAAVLLSGEQYKEAEFGQAVMRLGSHSYAVLSNELVVAAVVERGVGKVLAINPKTLDIAELPLGLVEVSDDAIERLSATSFLIIGAGIGQNPTLYKVELKDGEVKQTPLQSSTDTTYPASVFSEPQQVKVPAREGPKRDIYGFLWPPHNPKFNGPADEKPPLIVIPHGGPTSCSYSGLNLQNQYWNSKGYATFLINHVGSTGHGREYRDLLNSRWGIIDVDDVAETVKYLSDNGSIDGNKVGITGGSAGGYNVLQALCSYPKIFAAGVCLYGISEVNLLYVTTHKMEARYVDQLMFTENMKQEERDEIMRQRSPVHRADQITAPLLLQHGEKDRVVPISQAYTIYDVIKKKGGDIKLITFPGEGHGFRDNANLLRSLEEKEEWWARTLTNP